MCLKKINLLLNLIQNLKFTNNQIKSLQDELYKIANKAMQKRTDSQSTSFLVLKGINKKFL